MYIAGSGSPHVADAQVGEIRGYARLPPPPGWRKCPPLVIVSDLAEGSVLREQHAVVALCEQRGRGGGQGFR